MIENILNENELFSKISFSENISFGIFYINSILENLTTNP